MRPKYYIIILLFILALAGCKPKQEKFYEYKLVAVDSFSLPLIDSAYNLPYDLQYVQTDTANLLFVYYKNNSLCVYNFDTKKIVKTIPLRKNIPIFSFNVINLDSIIVFYNTSDFYRYNDTVFELLDFDGNVIRSYGIFDKHFKTKLLNDTDDVKTQYFTHTVFYKMPEINDKVFFSVEKLSMNFIGDTASRHNKFPSAGYLDLKDGKVNFIDFPKILPDSGYYYPYSYTESLTKTNTNTLLHIIPYSSCIFEYNFEDSSFKCHRIASMLLDTVVPEKDFEDAFYFFNYKGALGKVVYDNYRQLYYRNISLPKKLYKPTKVFVVVDTNFKILGEGIMPENYISKWLFTPDYVILVNAKKTFSTKGKIFFTKFVLKKEEVSRDSFMNKFEKLQDYETCNSKQDSTFKALPIKELFDNYISKETYAVIVLPFIKSCPSCKDHTMLYYSLNKEYYQKKNVYLFFDYTNKASLKAYLLKFRVKIDDKNIVIDTLQKYDDYVSNNFYNPRLVIVCKKKVVYDKTYYPDELSEMDSVLFSYSTGDLCNSK